MSLQGKKSPLGVNVLCALLGSTGLTINQTAAGFMGSSTAVGNYTKGSINHLNLVSDVIRQAYTKIGGNVSQTTYNNLIAIGSTSIPALGNSKPSTYTPTYSGEETSYGFLRTFALQAYNEFKYGTSSYSDFIQSFTRCLTFRDQSNKNICTLVNSKSFLDGIYSNMNDLTTADITGVTVSTVYWGQDLIASGKCIDLSVLDSFGKPSNLLLTMDKYHAITNAVTIALVAADFTPSEINDLISGKKVATIEQEKKLYSAYKLVRNKDLSEALIPLNVQTPGLQSLADLLNPQLLFPNSYSTLTVPKYNLTNSPTNSKIYYLIYAKEGLNSQLQGMDFGITLKGILPDNIAIACEALRFSMLQIKNIQKMSIEKFAQVVTNLETTKGLQINGTTKPTGNVDNALTSIAKGSGVNGQYTMNDFFGSMSGIPYDFITLRTNITSLVTPTLTNCYNNMITELNKIQDNNTVLTTLINQANTEIARIQTSNQTIANQLNTLYNSFGKQLSIEKAARAIALASDSVSTVSDIYGFCDSMDTYSVDTSSGQTAQTLEAISDTTTQGGQSLIGLMREVRNAKRLGLAGGVLDNDIPDTITAAPVNGLGIPKITGAAKAPGSFAGSPETGLIPQNLDIFNISTNLLPSVNKPQEAIQHVITCNCDCWDDILDL